jgi:RimJ/RimL family protein N-acetyltransferase
MFDFTIKTERLLLRPFSQADAPRLRELAGEVAVARNCASIPHPYPEGAAEQWIGLHDERRASDRGYPFAIEAQGQLIGCIGIDDPGNGEFDLGYWLGRAFWNQGYATEAAHAVLRFAFGWRGLPYVRAGFITQNTGSRRVLDKMGFLATGRYRAFHQVRGGEVEITRVILPRNAFAFDVEPLEQVYKAA